VFKPDKKLKWLPRLGAVQLKLQLEDCVVDVDVPPLEAAFIELFSQKDLFFAAFHPHLFFYDSFFLFPLFFFFFLSC